MLRKANPGYLRFWQRKRQKLMFRHIEDRGQEHSVNDMSQMNLNRTIQEKNILQNQSNHSHFLQLQQAILKVHYLQTNYIVE